MVVIFSNKKKQKRSETHSPPFCWGDRSAFRAFAPKEQKHTFSSQQDDHRADSRHLLSGELHCED